MRKHSSSVPFAALVLASLMGAAPAWAYVPPSAFIVKSLAAKHAGPKGLRVRTVVSAMDGEKATGVRIKTLTHYNPNTGVIHAYALDEQTNQKLYAVERRTDSSTPADALLFWSNGRNLGLALKAKGIPIRTDEDPSPEETRLARWGTAIAWVMGGKPLARGEAPGEAQLWVEKDTFLPLRLVAPALADDKLMDFQFEGTRYYHEYPFPRVVTVVRGKEPVLRDEVQDVGIALDAGEFRAPLANGYTDAGNSASGPVRDLIQKYFETIR